MKRWLNEVFLINVILTTQVRILRVVHPWLVAVARVQLKIDDRSRHFNSYSKLVIPTMRLTWTDLITYSRAIWTISNPNQIKSKPRVQVKIDDEYNKNLISSFFLNGPFPASFLYFSLFYKQLTVTKCSIKVADDWIRTRVLSYRKRPLCQLRHNHFTTYF